MVNFRLILIKQLAIKGKYATNKCFLEARSTEKYLVCLKLLLGSSRRDKRLARQSQEQLQTRLRLSSKLKIKKIVTHKLWRILRYNKLFSTVGQKLHNKALSKTFCLDTVNFVYFHSDENVK